MKWHIALTLCISVLVLTAICFSQENAPAEMGLKVLEAKLGKSIENREIVGEESVFMQNEKVYLWMKVTGGPADSLTLTWKHGSETYEVKLNIGGTPWRTWAYKTAWSTGEWSVTVSSASGEVLKEMNFTVKAAEPANP